MNRASLAVAPGELLAIVGPSGIGKSTLLLALLGMLPSSGSVSLLGQPLDRLSESALAGLRRRSIGVLSQELGLLPRLDARRNIALAAVLAGVGRRVALEQSDQALATLGLAEVARRPCALLSRGQQQRVAVARALLARRPLIVLDEPTTALDDDTTTRVITEIARRVSEGAAVLCATHDPRLVAAASRVLQLRPT